MGATRQCTTRSQTRENVASYTAVQLAATVAITRAFGYRVTPTALLACAAINAGTHAVIDRGALLLWLAKKTKKTGYIEHCQAVRLDDEGAVTKEIAGPVSAWMELDRGAPPRGRDRRRRRHHLAHHPARRPPVSRTRLERVRAAVGIAALALQ
ncbi:hypothetical protein B591_31083 (plasmid) [Streptomyces sp. GBA 94-10 4N24]|uniref:hypothetical protein n=1 Tax=Streptomyces sp. GBA 94-10 4N24 TaxID=1218177 RepID=UPI0003C2C293|nr:hypothetical protein [Streptomyces sp. GBA 94-10 4N24]ESP95736.1 hypothetical protein B591_31083 [Streptomyces sp. GBA 94-10 4N24]UZN63196.1 hypothetical protein B591N_31083 [Streptomyces sp. GBA 94-10 4N24]